MTGRRRRVSPPPCQPFRRWPPGAQVFRERRRAAEKLFALSLNYRSRGLPPSSGGARPVYVRRP